MLHVGFLPLPRFTLLPFAAMIDVLRLAADEGDRSRPIRCRWEVLGTDARPVRASCGVTVTPWSGLDHPERFDYLVVVGGLLPGAEDTDPRIITYLRRAADAGVTLVGVCTASFVLVRAGLMAGRQCCVSWYHYGDLLAEAGDVVPVADRLFVVDRGRITCAGGTGALDLAAWMVERHCGRPLARKSLNILVADRARPADAAQPRRHFTGDIADRRIARAVQLMEQRLDAPPSNGELAAHIGLSRRQFERLFAAETGQSPQAFCRRLRLEYGARQLTAGGRSVTEVALDCGFTDSAHFIRHFSRQYGCSPSRWREEGRLSA